MGRKPSQTGLHIMLLDEMNPIAGALVLIVYGYWISIPVFLGGREAGTFSVSRRVAVLILSVIFPIDGWWVTLGPWRCAFRIAGLTHAN